MRDTKAEPLTNLIDLRNSLASKILNEFFDI